MIRHAKISDLEQILSVYSQARDFMRLNQNPNQWKNTYPQEEVILKDIADNRLYVVERQEKICGVFYFAVTNDPTYKIIEQGNWISHEPYGVIHRIASEKTAHGVFKESLGFCLKKISHLRIDTHADNKIMQHVLEKNGFKRCGIIYLANGDERIAYERV